MDHVLRGWLLGMMLTFGFAVGGLGSADGAVLLRRQVGPFAAPASGGDEPHTAAGLVYWLVMALSLKKLYLWAAVADVTAALQIRMDQ